MGDLKRALLAALADEYPSDAERRLAAVRTWAENTRDAQADLTAEYRPGVLRAVADVLRILDRQQ